MTCANNLQKKSHPSVIFSFLPFPNIATIQVRMPKHGIFIARPFGDFTETVARPFDGRSKVCTAKKCSFLIFFCDFFGEKENVRRNFAARTFGRIGQMGPIGQISPIEKWSIASDYLSNNSITRRVAQHQICVVLFDLLMKYCGKVIFFYKSLHISKKSSNFAARKNGSL